MNSKKIIASLLVAVMSLSVAGCSVGKSPVRDYAAILDDMDFEEVDAKEYRKMDREDGDFEDGTFASSNKSSDFKGLLDDFTYADIYGEHLAGALAAKKYIEDDYISNFAVYVLQYKNTAEAEDFFDDLDKVLGEDTKSFDYWKDYGEFETDSDDDYYLLAGQCDVTGYDTHLRIGAYIDGKTVVIAISVSADDNVEEFIELMDDFCDNADLKNPGDLL